MPPNGTDRLTRAAYRAIAWTHQQLLRAEKVLAEASLVLHTDALERYAVDAHYAAASQFRDNLAYGLFPFETRALERYFPKPPARLLVPGVGGGREALALIGRGYEVDAFDAATEMVEAARRVLAPRPVEQLTVQAWADRVLTGEAPRCDGVFTGWGMWCHLLRQSDRLRVLSAFRAACPLGPILVSFIRAEQVFDPLEHGLLAQPLHPEPQPGLEHISRKLVRERLLRRPPVERGTRWADGTFWHDTSECELFEEAARAGLTLAYYERDGMRSPHAVLLPGSGS